jgi:hypothetical protein
MDLLGDYDSDDNSASSSIVASSRVVAVVPGKAPSVVQELTMPTTDQQKPSSNQNKQQKRGKKLLKLQAVLPHHIWNQLTTTASSSGRNDSDDDDEDDDERDTKKPAVSTQSNRHNQSPSSSSGKSLLKLLNAIPKSKTATKTLGVGGILGNVKATTTDTNVHPPSTSLNARPLSSSPRTTAGATTTTTKNSSSSLGAAFLESTVQVTRTKTGNVRSIHSQCDQSPSSNYSTRTKTDTAQDEKADFPSDADIAETHAPYGTKSMLRPLAFTNQTSTENGMALPRPIQPTITTTSSTPTVRQRLAAPPVLRTTAGAPYRMAMYPTDLEGGAQRITPHSHLQQHQQSQKGKAAAPPLSNKVRKRQMEAMLRAGNLDAVDSDVHLSGGGNTNYAAQALLQQQAVSAAPHFNAHGVRVVPTSHYNTATGKMDASATISGKQKGKNQLNALMVNAASLEASRLENPQQLSNNASTHRNNAKRKYGW